MTDLRQQSTTTRPFQFAMFQSVDHITPATGLTITLTISKNGGAFGAASGAVTELSGGFYSWAGNATDRNTLGELAILATATGADSFLSKLIVVPWDPFDAAALGLTNLDTTVSSRAAPGAAMALVSSAISTGTFASGAINAAAIGAAAITSAKFAADAVDSNALATSAANEIRDAILTDATRFAGANIDAAISSRATNTGAASAVWEEARAGHVTAGTFGQGVASVTGAVGSVASGGISATSFAANAVDSGALATSAVNEIRDAILSDSTPFQGARIDAAISSRATAATAAAAVWDEVRASHVTAGTFGQGVASVQGNVTGSTASIGAGGIVAATFGANAIDSGALATSAANEIRDAILSDSTPFQGARIDATISSRASQTSLNPLIDASIEHTFTVASGSTTTVVNTNATQASSFFDNMIIVFRNAAGNVARAVTSYSSTNGAFTVSALPFTPSAADTVYVIGDVASTGGGGGGPTLSQIVNGVWDELRASHTTSGTFGQGAASVQGNVTGSVASIGAAGIAAASFAANAIDSSALAASAANEIRDTILSDATPFQGARIDAAISSRASQTSVTALSNATIAASLTAASGSTTTNVRTTATQATGFYDGMVLVIVNAAGTAARNIASYSNTNGAFTVSALPFTPALSDAVFVIARNASSGLTAGQVSAAVWDEPRASHTTSGTFGEGGNVVTIGAGALTASSFAVDAITASALAASATSEIDTVLTAAHGAGSWQSGGGGGGASTRVQTNVTFDASTNTLRVNAWLEGAGGVITSGATNGTFRLFDAAGTALTSTQTDAAPDANGVFYWTVAAPAFVIGETPTYITTSIDYLSVTYPGVTGVTFSRAI